MRTFLGASGAERNGLAAEGGVGCKLTSTQEGNQEWGVVSFTAPPHLSSQGSDPWKSRLAFSLHTHMHIHTHTHTPPPGTPPPLHTHRRR